MKNRFIWLGIALAFIVALAMPNLASASSVSYDVALGAPGWFSGTGNPNGGFTLYSDSGVELALRAKYRQNPLVINTPTDLYSVVAGAQTNATSGGNGASATRAAWNYEMGINLRPGGVGALTLNDILATTITIQDLTAGTSSGPMGFFTAYAFDHDLYGPSGKVPETLANMATSWAAQNSENPTFGNFGIPFNMNDPHYYRISMNVLNGERSLVLGSIDVSVDGAVPTPEPASLLFLGTGLVGMATMARKRLFRKSAV